MKRARKSLLRRLVDEDLYERNRPLALLDAALQVRRAGLEHLVLEATQDEVLALAMAGEQLETERAYLVGRAVHSPTDVSAKFDGGRGRDRHLLKSAARAAAEAGSPRATGGRS